MVLTRFLRNTCYRIQRYKGSKVQTLSVCECVEPLISKQETNFWKSISAGERLSVTLRFLITAESQQSLLFSYRMGKSVVSNTISETCDAIYNVLWKACLQPPTSPDEWLPIAKGFEEK